MPYTPQPTNDATPSDSEAVGTAAAEFRALKTSINTLRTYLGSQASFPTTDLQGNPLASGDFFYHSATYNFYVYDAGAAVWRVFQNTATTGLITSTAITLNQNTADVLNIGTTGNTTITDSLPSGSNKLLIISNVGGYTVTWPAGVKWVNGVSPTIGTTGVTLVNLIKVSTDLYGIAVGGAV
jgi:hypothetical protein